MFLWDIKKKKKLLGLVTSGALFPSRRKLSTKSKKWKSIFNLGRSGSESKSKLSRNGSVFVRAQKLSGKNILFS